MTVKMPPGPPCDGCGGEAAAMSLLSYGDYSQVKLGVNCAPSFLRSIADSIDGKTTAEVEGETPDPELTDDAPTPEQAAAGAAAAAAEDDEPGSARDHWASTTNVRRSTHGHRRPSSATGDRRTEPEQ